jgi:hypothetical protein
VFFPLLVLLIVSALAAHPGRPGGPKLLVLVVFDQLRGDYLSRWRHLFAPDGFRRLTTEGTWFTNCHYPYSLTVTGPGHASLGTGCVPSQHGIVENDWFDRQVGKIVYCSTFGDRYHMVPVGAKSKSGKNDGGAPTRLLVPTVGDVVKQTTGGRGKVIGLSLKDRGAVLPTGAKADVCFWYDDTQGAFVTSNYYEERLPAYMKRFNALRLADQWFDKHWVRLRTDLDYTAHSSVDDMPGEGDDKKKTNTFPHSLAMDDKQAGSKFYNRVYASPFGNELTWAAAQAILEGERLGRDEDVDYLVISFSSNDAVGHLYGPDSQEVLDITLRSDLIVADLIRTLDATVGRANYLLVLSADHGICPLPEVARGRSPQAGRLDPKPLVKALEEHLNEKYGTKLKWIEATTGAGLYLRRAALKAAAQSSTDVENACRDWLLAWPSVRTVYTRTDLAARVNHDPLLAKVRASFHPDRSPDVMPILQPYVFTSSYKNGTTHGSPHDYDTHVPLVVFGAGVAPQVRGERTMPQTAAVILAHSLGQRIANAACEMPAGVLEGR